MELNHVMGYVSEKIPQLSRFKGFWASLSLHNRFHHAKDPSPSEGGDHLL